jgi:hypothetical protein
MRSCQLSVARSEELSVDEDNVLPGLMRRYSKATLQIIEIINQRYPAETVK